MAQATVWVESAAADRRDRYGYPAYDTFRAATRSQPLDEADLLAPVLLGAVPDPGQYYWLVDQLDVLNRALNDIPADADLAGPQTSPIALEPLFAVLDGRRPTALAMLSKVLHRKRPGFIPLWDSSLGTVYQVGESDPVRLVRNRGFGQFAVAFGTALRRDLQASEQWTSLGTRVSGPPVSALRVLDLVARNLASR